MPIPSLLHKPHHGEPDPDDEPAQLPVEPDQGPSPTSPGQEPEPDVPA